MDVTVDQSSLTFAGRTLASFVPTMNLKVEGFKNDYRSDGLGAPLAAGLAPAPQPDSGLVLPPNLPVPTSAVLQMDNPRRQLTGSALAARLALYTIYDTATIPIDGQEVPLEYDQTAVRALIAVEGKGWTRELSGLLNNVLSNQNNPTAKDHLFALEPHRRGRIPVVLVHGTASSPFRWRTWSTTCWRTRKSATTTSSGFSPTTPATDPDLGQRASPFAGGCCQVPRRCAGRSRTQQYGSDRPQPGRAANQDDPFESGTKIWDAISDKPVDELNLKPETRAVLKEALFVHPLPFVETVIFISTPHGGSYRAA